jgi:EF-P beta-lysylation protein EpmB
MINTGTCAINCRYCFRRNFPYRDHQLSKQKEAAALEAVQQDEVISEIILSGGDPLLLSDQRLSRLLIDLSGVPHLRRIRIHSRLPIVLPARITQALIRLLENSQRPVVMVVHCNHPREINQHVTEACGKLKQAGVSLFNQSVLLKGVNDHAEVLCELSEKLFDNGVTPYYLHQLDKAAGTGHFEVARQAAVNLINEMQNRLPGYLVPKLVFEQAGASSKLFVADYLTDV